MTLRADLTPAPVAGRVRRVTPPVALAGGVLVVSVALHFRDPHEAGSWGLCPWLALTGSYCPGCGGLRAVNDLTRGDVAAAASSNLMLVSALPLLAVLWLRSVRDRWVGESRPMSPRLFRAVAWSLAVTAAVFTVARNLPGGAGLAP